MWGTPAAFKWAKLSRFSQLGLGDSLDFPKVSRDFHETNPSFPLFVSPFERYLFDCAQPGIGTGPAFGLNAKRALWSAFPWITSSPTNLV